MEKQDTKNLKKRYLIWFYKTTKEAFDRIERKFTQSEVDRFILKELENASFDNKNIDKYIQEFEDYIENKEKDGVSLKYEKGKLKPEYSFLEEKLKAIEKAIVKELGESALKEIKSLYEREMTERILRSTEH
ncbi:MAG: hypothetical protein PHW54_05240 [Candidatus Omnitrophica bacterium]|jgi:hypothetical protein|nr:hypothetical protein [Candidatus Omnitrophota bacterium]